MFSILSPPTCQKNANDDGQREKVVGRETVVVETAVKVVTTHRSPGLVNGYFCIPIGQQGVVATHVPFKTLREEHSALSINVVARPDPSFLQRFGVGTMKDLLKRWGETVGKYAWQHTLLRSNGFGKQKCHDVHAISFVFLVVVVGVVVGVEVQQLVHRQSNLGRHGKRF